MRESRHCVTFQVPAPAGVWALRLFRLLPIFFFSCFFVFRFPCPHLGQRVPGVLGDGLFQQLQRLVVPLERVQRHAQVAVQHGGARVDGQRAPEVVLRQLQLLLLVVDRAQPVPGRRAPGMSKESTARSITSQ